VIEDARGASKIVSRNKLPWELQAEKEGEQEESEKIHRR
jgi:hypothetical protein